jgi:hypothetical protein
MVKMSDAVYKFIYYCVLLCISSFSAVSALELGVGTHFQYTKKLQLYILNCLRAMGLLLEMTILGARLSYNPIIIKHQNM